MKSPMNEFLRRYQPVQVQRFRDSYSFDLNQEVTWFPFSHFGLFSFDHIHMWPHCLEPKDPGEPSVEQVEGFWL